jgi:hypothetical protein
MKQFCNDDQQPLRADASAAAMASRRPASGAAADAATTRQRSELRREGCSSVSS